METTRRGFFGLVAGAVAAVSARDVVAARPEPIPAHWKRVGGIAIDPAALSYETRPADGPIVAGDFVVASDNKRDGYFSVRKATSPDDRIIGVAVTGNHALGFVTLTRGPLASSTVSR
jgi:hypothetical protein